MKPAVPIALSLVLLLALVPAALAQPFDDDPATVQRIDLSVPEDVAVEVSRMRFPADGTATSAVIATGADFADALTGSSLTDGAPLMLTGPDALYQPVADELRRVLPQGSTVYLLGGEEALEPQVADDLQALGYLVQRLAGESRFETAAEVARERLRRGPVDEVLLARGLAVAEPTQGWADAISGGSAQLRPILLTPSDTPHETVAGFLQDVPEASVIILGGLQAISQDVEDATPRVIARLAGATRDGTAAAIAERFLGMTSETPGRRVVAYNGYVESGWRYGLPVAALAREQQAALMPMASSATAEATARLIACGAEQADLLVVGDTFILSDEAVAAHRSCPGPAEDGSGSEDPGLIDVPPGTAGRP